MAGLNRNMSTPPPALDGLRIHRPAAPPARSRGWLVVVVVLLLLGAGAGVTWLKLPKAVVVHTALVREMSGAQDRTLLNASGYVTARREATISAKNTGKVTEVLVEEGMKVDADQILARLDATNVDAGLKQAEAELDSAHTALDEITANLELAQREQARVEQLAANDFVSKSDVDHYQTDVRVQQARLTRQQAEVAVAEKTLQVWKQQMDDTIIRAPFAGVVISKDAQPGEMVSPISAGGGFTRTGICTIVDMGSLEIDVDVNESYINRVQDGQPVEATLDAYPDWKIPAKVIAIIPTADRQKATVKVRVGFEKLDPRVLPDMSAKVAFQSAETTPTATATAGDLLIPQGAVQQADGKSVAWVFNDGHAERRAITVGATHGADIAVSAGLHAGEKIILDGDSPLVDGVAVSEAKP
jgi:RND family efflux transporter MFP subunit